MKKKSIETMLEIYGVSDDFSTYNEKEDKKFMATVAFNRALTIIQSILSNQERAYNKIKYFSLEPTSSIEYIDGENYCVVDGTYGAIIKVRRHEKIELEYIKLSELEEKEYSEDYFEIFYNNLSEINSVGLFRTEEDKEFLNSGLAIEIIKNAEKDHLISLKSVDVDDIVKIEKYRSDFVTVFSKKYIAAFRIKKRGMCDNDDILNATILYSKIK